MTRSRFWQAVTLIVCLSVVVSFSAFSAVQVSVLSSVKEVAPGEFATHVFSVTNDSASADTFDLSFRIPPGWGILGAPTSLSLDPGEEGTLFVTVTVPPGATAGEYSVTLTATSRADPTRSTTASASMSVSPVNELDIIMPDPQSVPPGKTVTYEVIVINRGNAQDTMKVEANSADGYPVTLSNSILNLVPQERATVTVTINVPTDADPGRDLLSFSVFSVLYAGVKKEDTLFTTVLPPSPQAVGGTLMEELPARLRLSFGQNVFTGELNSSLTFSVSGGVLDGYFSSYLRFSSIFGPDPLDLGSFYISYRLKPSTYKIGDVSQKITDLLSVYGRGGSLLIDADYYRLALVAGGSGDETRGGIGLAVGPSVARLGIAHMEKRSSTSQQTVWSLTASAQPLDDWTMRMEGALGLKDTLSSRAFFFNTKINTTPYYLSGQVFSVGSYFPGSRRDSAGLSLSQRLRQNDFSLSVSISHNWDNLSQDPSVSTTIEDELGLNISASPLEDGPTINSTVEFTWARDPDLTAQNDVRRMMSVELGDSSGSFPYSFSGKLNDQIDNITDISYRTLTFSEGIGVSIEDIDLFLKLTHIRNLDLNNGDILSGGTTVNLRFRANSSLHSASISVGNDEDDFDISASISAELLDNLDLDMSARIGWDRADATPPTFSWTTTFSWQFDLPLPFLITKGRITGHVFIDVNGDGKMNKGEAAVQGAVIETERSEVSTDADGRFRFPPLEPGTYTLSVSGLPLNARLASEPTVMLDAGKTVDVNIPLTPVTIIDGVLFNDVDKNGLKEDDEGGLAQVRIVLTDETGNERDTFTNGQGKFSFTDVMPGKYRVSVDSVTLPDRFVFTTDESVMTDVLTGTPPTVVLGGFIKPKEIVITFQPPTADFYFTPDNPRAGESITFDGSDSFDFDGEVVAYEWDFDGDGKADATGVTAETTFPTPGSYEVTLTITDNDGNTDAISYTIDVK